MHNICPFTHLHQSPGELWSKLSGYSFMSCSVYFVVLAISCVWGQWRHDALVHVSITYRGPDEFHRGCVTQEYVICPADHPTSLTSYKSKKRLEMSAVAAKVQWRVKFSRVNRLWPWPYLSSGRPGNISGVWWAQGHSLRCLTRWCDIQASTHILGTCPYCSTWPDPK